MGKKRDVSMKNEMSPDAIIHHAHAAYTWMQRHGCKQFQDGEYDSLMEVLARAPEGKNEVEVLGAINVVSEMMKEDKELLDHVDDNVKAKIAALVNKPRGIRWFLEEMVHTAISTVVSILILFLIFPLVAKDFPHKTFRECLVEFFKFDGFALVYTLVNLCATFFVNGGIYVYNRKILQRKIIQKLQSPNQISQEALSEKIVNNSILKGLISGLLSFLVGYIVYIIQNQE